MKLRNASDPKPGSIYPDPPAHKARLRELDLKSLPYVALPPAPLRWEQARCGEGRTMPEAEDAFEVRDAKWRLTAVQQLVPAERPEPAFRRLYPVDGGLLMIDDLGKAKGLGPIKAAALRCDRDGRLVAKAGFARGIYRLGAHPLGHGLVALSPDAGTVRIYSRARSVSATLGGRCQCIELPDGLFECDEIKRAMRR